MASAMSSKRSSAKALSRRPSVSTTSPMIQRLTGRLGLGRGDALRRADAIALEEARGVPQLGREVAVALDPLLIELDVAALAFHRRQGEAQRVGAIFVDQAERVDRIALRLGHFLPVRVADQAVEVERAPRHLVHELHPLHRHPRIPEEQDVEAGDQHVVGIVALEIVGLLRPAERGERPQRRGEPGVEHILVLAQLDALARLLLRLGKCFGDKNIAVGIEPCRNAVAPPQLARNAPGLDILEPVEPGLRPGLRHDLDVAGARRRHHPLGQRRDIHIPLVGQPGFDHHARTVAVGRGDGAVLDLLQRAFGFEQLDDPLARIEPVEAKQFGRDQPVLRSGRYGPSHRAC